MTCTHLANSRGVLHTSFCVRCHGWNYYRFYQKWEQGSGTFSEGFWTPRLQLETGFLKTEEHDLHDVSALANRLFTSSMELAMDLRAQRILDGHHRLVEEITYPQQ